MRMRRGSARVSSVVLLAALTIAFPGAEVAFAAANRRTER
jgi:hypothetical protein